MFDMFTYSMFVMCHAFLSSAHLTYGAAFHTFTILASIFNANSMPIGPTPSAAGPSHPHHEHGTSKVIMSHKVEHGHITASKHERATSNESELPTHTCNFDD